MGRVREIRLAVMEEMLLRRRKGLFEEADALAAAWSALREVGECEALAGDRFRSRVEIGAGSTQAVLLPVFRAYAKDKRTGRRVQVHEGDTPGECEAAYARSAYACCVHSQLVVRREWEPIGYWFGRGL